MTLYQADYTAWEWRWQCLQALGADLTQEYTFTDSIMHVGHTQQAMTEMGWCGQGKERALGREATRLIHA